MTSKLPLRVISGFAKLLVEVRAEPLSPEAAGISAADHGKYQPDERSGQCAPYLFACHTSGRAHVTRVDVRSMVESVIDGRSNRPQEIRDPRPRGSCRSRRTATRHGRPGAVEAGVCQSRVERPEVFAYRAGSQESRSVPVSKRIPWSTLSGITASGFLGLCEEALSVCSSDCIRKANLKARAWDSPMYARSSSDTAAGSGRKASREREPRSMSLCPVSRLHQKLHRNH